MTVLVVNSLRVLGGGEKWFLGRAPLWADRGVEMRFVCRPDTPLQRQAASRGLPVLPVEMRHDLSDRKSTRLNSSHLKLSRMPSSA